MRRTRATYYYFLRKVERDEDTIINERQAEYLLKNDARDFRFEIKHIRSCETGTSCSVDGHTEATSIVELFADEYHDLYTSVPYDVNEMHHIHMKSIVDLQMNRHLLIIFSIFMLYEMQFRVLKHIRTTAALV